MAATSSTDYPKFRPIPRLHRSVVVTEKVNGTNGLIEVVPVAEYFGNPGWADRSGYAVSTEQGDFIVFAGSRNRWLSPEGDNFGFARWVWDNAETLATGLGEGKHYGEWFGKGIQSGYGLDEKRFALFNVNRWYDPRNPDVNENYALRFPKAQPIPALDTLTVVPPIIVANGTDLNYAVDLALHTLETEGSIIAPGFMNPEGVVVWHDAAGVYFKATIKNDEQPKSKVTSK